MTSEEPEPHHAHITQTRAMFRSVGFDLHAMQFPRSPDALAGLRRFNRVPDSWRHPIPWNYHPNAYMRDNWRKLYG